MQSAKKLVLVDEFNREYKRLQRPSAAVVRPITVLVYRTLSATVVCPTIVRRNNTWRSYIGISTLTIKNRLPSSRLRQSIGLRNPNACNRANLQQKKRKKTEEKENRLTCHALVTMGLILMHSTALLVRPAVFPAFATCDVTVDERRPK